MTRKEEITRTLYLEERLQLTWEEFEEIIQKRELDLSLPLIFYFDFCVLEPTYYGQAKRYKLTNESFGQSWHWDGYDALWYKHFGDDENQWWEQFLFSVDGIKRELALTIMTYLGQAFSEIRVVIHCREERCQIRYYEYGKKSAPLVDGKLDLSAIEIDERTSMQIGETDIEIEK